MDFIKKNGQIIFIELLLVVVFILCYGRFGDVMVDSFREAYIPAEVLHGKILYKNIFTIYAPFAYLFNSILFWIFGVKLGVLYTAGLITTMGIFYLTYKISRIYLDYDNIPIVLFFMLSGLVLSPNVFNAIFPYSYGILYGLFFILASIYCTVNKKYPLAYLMYSFAICSKYEFLLFLPLLIIVSGRKDIIKNIIAFIIPVILNFLPLIIQKVDFSTSLFLISRICAAKTLSWFYSVMGLKFRPEILIVYGINLLKILVPFFLFCVPKINRKLLSVILLICFCFLSYQDVFIYLFPLIVLLFIFRFKNLDGEERFFIAASVLLSLKVFWAFTLQSYGVFFIPFALISLLIVIPSDLRRNVISVIVLWAIVIAAHNIYGLYNKNVRIENSVVRTYPKYGNSINLLNKYIEKNIKSDERVLVYPEGLGVNLTSGRRTDDKFYSLTPLYVETFGEDIIIKRLELTKPECIVISDYDTSLYYYKEFGKDYAIRIKDYIKKNYRQDAILSDGLTFEVYRRR